MRPREPYRIPEVALGAARAHLGYRHRPDLEIGIVAHHMRRPPGSVFAVWVAHSRHASPVVDHPALNPEVRLRRPVCAAPSKEERMLHSVGGPVRIMLEAMGEDVTIDWLGLRGRHRPRHTAALAREERVSG